MAGQPEIKNMMQKVLQEIIEQERQGKSPYRQKQEVLFTADPHIVREFSDGDKLFTLS